MAAQSLYGLWIENERIMSPLHRVVDIGSRLIGVVERKLSRPVKRGRATGTGWAEHTTTALSSGAANTKESGVTASNTGSMPCQQLAMDF